MDHTSGTSEKNDRIFMPIILIIVSALTLFSLWLIASGELSFDNRTEATDEGQGLAVPSMIARSVA